MDELQAYIRQFANFTPDEWSLLTNSTQEVHLRKDDYFLREGQICQKVGFIAAGILRIHYFDGDDEVTRYFVRQNQFAVDLDSLYQQTPSGENIQAVTDCRLLVTTKTRMEQLSTQIQQWSKITHQMTEQALLEKLRLRSPLVVEDARTRYEHFIKEQPDVALYAPLQYIASYLGMTQQSLSRIRRQLSESAL